MTEPVLACVALGANLGDAQETVKRALAYLERLPQTQLIQASSLYRTAPYEAQGPDFINAVALVQTQLSPLDLLHALQGIEQAFGRERPYRNAPRTLDLDLIVYEQQQMASAELTLPHPRYRERAFVLHPMAEVAPQWVDPDWLIAVADQSIIRL